MAAGGSPVTDSQKEKDLAGLVKFSTDSLEIEFSTDKIAMTSVTLVVHQVEMHPICMCTFLIYTLPGVASIEMTLPAQPAWLSG